MADSRVHEIQSEVAAIRRDPLAPELKSLLEAVGNELGVEFEVVSGGQSGTRRTGSTRHDHGKAADVKAFVRESDGSKRYLDQSKKADRQVWSEIIKLSVAGGATGVGAAPNYMGNFTAHIGFGKKAVWGKKGEAPQKWVVDAVKAARFVPPGSIPKVASLTDTKRAPQPLAITKTITEKRAAVAGIPPGFDSPKTPAQVSALYAGILPGKTVLGGATTAKATPKPPVAGLKLPVAPVAKPAPSATVPAPKTVLTSATKAAVTASGRTVAQIGQEADNARLSGYRAIQEMGPSSKGTPAKPAPAKKGVIKTTAPEQQPIPHDVVPATLKAAGYGTGSVLTTPRPSARDNINDQRSEQLAQRQALSAAAGQRAAAAQQARAAAEAKQRALAEGARAAAQKAAMERVAQERARQQAAAAARAAALAASRPKITGVGGGGAYTTTEFQQDRFQTTSGSLMPASTNNSRWTTGY